MTPQICPQCGGTVTLKEVGTLRDKVLQCPYCEYMVDVPDEYEVSRVEEESRRPGHYRRVQVTEHRRDLGPDEAPVAGRSLPTDQDGRDVTVLRESLSTGGVPPPGRREQRTGSGMTLERISDGETHIEIAGDGASDPADLPPEVLDQLREQLGDDAADVLRSGATGPAGKRRVIRRTVTEHNTLGPDSRGQGNWHTPAHPANPWVSVVKWLVVLAVVIGTILIALRMLG